jgi:hypothetical protein
LSRPKPTRVAAPIEEEEEEDKKKLVNCYIWSIALYGAETWTLRKVDEIYLGSSEMWL